eukprot:11978794-Alexandrium_andersonii.AAC.1
MFCCPIDECGHNFCEPCSLDHDHGSRQSTPRLDPDRYRMPEGEEQEGAAAGLAELTEAGRERAVRGMVTGDELRALAKQRSLDTPIARIARQEAAASLSS